MAMAPPLSHRDITRFHHHPHLISLLKHYGKTNSLSSGRILHDFLLRSTCFDHDQSLQNLLVDMYGSCGSLKEAQNIFDSLLHPNVYSWNVLLHGYGKHGSLAEARSVFERIPHPDVCSWNTLIKLVSQYGCLDDTKFVFGMIPYRNVVSWNALITGYAEHDQNEEVLKCYEQMLSEGLSPNEVTYIGVLNACGSTRAIHKGTLIHEEIVSKDLLKKDISLASALVSMYAKCGALVKAHSGFEEIRVRNVVSWNALITGYVQHGQEHEALNSFERLRTEGFLPNAVTFTCILKACGSVGAIDKGKQIHDEIVNLGLLKEDLVLGNALVDMYVKYGMMEKAQEVLQKLLIRDVVSWNSLFAGYVQHGWDHKALDCYELMQFEGLTPNAITFTCIFMLVSLSHVDCFFPQT